ncbi:MAG: tyrosine-type recombinase/integrase [Tissierellia bacterium]|nr:tyrosine-type recombinase/integrase [Tissierellia bacterium]
MENLAFQDNIIDFNVIKANKNINILPAVHPIQSDVVQEHSAEPIKSVKDIKRIIQYFLNQKQYRNLMLFVVGICTGLRCSDLRMLKFSDFINSDLTYKEELIIFEIKTRNTRKQAKNRHIYINDMIKWAISLYLKHSYRIHLDNYLFRSESNNGYDKNQPMTRRAIENVLKSVTKKLHIDVRAGTHLLRKTFSYQTIAQSKDKTRSLQILQMLLGHSSESCTLRYAGITDDELTKTYQNLDFKLDDILCSKREEKAL